MDYIKGFVTLCEVFVTIPVKKAVKVPTICDLEFKSIKLNNKMYKESVVPVKAETFSGMAAKR